MQRLMHYNEAHLVEYSKHTHNHNTHHMKSLLTRKDVCIWLSQQLRGRYRGTGVPQVIRHGSTPDWRFASGWCLWVIFHFNAIKLTPLAQVEGRLKNGRTEKFKLYVFNAVELGIVELYNVRFLQGFL